MTPEIISLKLPADGVGYPAPVESMECSVLLVLPVSTPDCLKYNLNPDIEKGPGGLSGLSGASGINRMTGKISKLMSESFNTRLTSGIGARGLSRMAGFVMQFMPLLEL